MIVGLLPLHFIMAINGKRVASYGNTHEDFVSAMKMKAYCPREGD